jgi:hypothetical protein
MQRLWVVLLVVGFVLGGCAKPLKDQLLGTWKIDPLSLKAQGLDMSNKAVADLAKKQMDTTRFELRKDGTLTAYGINGSGTGKWTLVGTTMKVTLDDAKAQEGIGKSLTFTPNADGSKIHLKQDLPSPAEMDLVKTQ